MNFIMYSTILDLRTLSFALALIAILLSLIMVFIWRNHKTYPGFGFWTIGNFVAAMGFLALFLRGAIPDFLSIVVGNTLVLASIIIHLQGVRKFREMSDLRFFSLSILLLNIVLFSYFTYLYDDIILRIVITSTLITIVCAKCAYDLVYRMPKGMERAYRIASLVFISNCILLITRAALTYFASDIEDLYTPDSIQSIHLTLTILFTLAWTFSFINLNSERLQQDLKTAQIKLEKLATTDFLTDISNNRHFFEVSKYEIKRARRYNTPLTVVLFDLDYFKKINDSHGHSIGDKVLKEIAETCQNTLRSSDCLGRLGGEEFGILLTNTELSAGITVAENLRKAIETNKLQALNGGANITASFGVSALNRDDEKINTVIERADEALYKAKAKGRNQVIAEQKNAVSFSTPKKRFLTEQPS